MSKVIIYGDELYHHGIKGMRWGVRRYQNKNGTLTPKGKEKLRSLYEKRKRRTASNIDFYNSQKKETRDRIKELKKNGITDDELLEALKDSRLSIATADDPELAESIRSELNDYGLKGSIKNGKTSNKDRITRTFLGYSDDDILRGMYETKLSELKTDYKRYEDLGKSYAESNKSLMNYPIDKILEGNSGYRNIKKEIKSL